MSAGLMFVSPDDPAEPLSIGFDRRAFDVIGRALETPERSAVMAVGPWPLDDGRWGWYARNGVNGLAFDPPTVALGAHNRNPFWSRSVIVGNYIAPGGDW